MSASIALALITALQPCSASALQWISSFERGPTHPSSTQQQIGYVALGDVIALDHVVQNVHVRDVGIERRDPFDRPDLRVLGGVMNGDVPAFDGGLKSGLPSRFALLMPAPKSLVDDQSSRTDDSSHRAAGQNKADKISTADWFHFVITSPFFWLTIILSQLPLLGIWIENFGLLAEEARRWCRRRAAK